MVEDNQDDELLLMHMLEGAQLDRQIDIVRDGKRAFDRLTSDQSLADDLLAVFLDLNLPAINGLRLLEMIKADDRLTHLPVIVMTSSNSPADLRECERLGVTSYVKKPLTLATFTKALADIFHLPPRTKKSSDEA